MVEDRQHAGDADDARRDDEAEQLVAVGRVADEARPLLVLADRHEHVPDGRAMEAPEEEHDDEADGGDDAVIDAVPLEIDAEHGGAGDAAEPALAAGEVGPAIGDREQERRQGEGQEREIDAAAAQDERAGERRRRRR